LNESSAASLGYFKKALKLKNDNKTPTTCAEIKRFDASEIHAAA
jgi:hypothetical protein